MSLRLTPNDYATVEGGSRSPTEVLACGLGHISALTVHRTVIHYRNAVSLYELHYPERAQEVSLRLGHISALTVHWTVIHYRNAATLLRKG